MHIDVIEFTDMAHYPHVLYEVLGGLSVSQLILGFLFLFYFESTHAIVHIIL